MRRTRWRRRLTAVPKREYAGVDVCGCVQGVGTPVCLCLERTRLMRQNRAVSAGLVLCLAYGIIRAWSLSDSGGT